MHQLCAFAEENREGERERERERAPETAPVLQCYVAYHASRRLGGSSTLGKGPKKNTKKKIVRSQRRNVGEEERERERERERARDRRRPPPKMTLGRGSGADGMGADCFPKQARFSVFWCFPETVF